MTGPDPARMPAALRTIDEVLGAARARLRRLHAREAWAAQRAGALLVDIRPESYRRLEGEIPGSVVIERTVLEWRLDPASDARLPVVVDHDLYVVVVCNEGYSSSLAAASLQDLGLHRATDLVDGYRAWRSLGLPTVPGGTRAGDYVPARPPRGPDASRRPGGLGRLEGLDG